MCHRRILYRQDMTPQTTATVTVNRHTPIYRCDGVTVAGWEYRHDGNLAVTDGMTVS